MFTGPQFCEEMANPVAFGCAGAQTERSPTHFYGCQTICNRPRTFEGCGSPWSDVSMRAFVRVRTFCEFVCDWTGSKPGQGVRLEREQDWTRSKTGQGVKTGQLLGTGFVDVLCRLWVECYMVKVIHLLLKQNTTECIRIKPRCLQMNEKLQSISVCDVCWSELLNLLRREELSLEAYRSIVDTPCIFMWSVVFWR